MTNIKKEQMQKKMIKMLDIQEEFLFEYIARSIGYFNKLKNSKKKINEYDIINFHFILQDIKEKQEVKSSKINYGNISSKVILRYSKEILDMRFIEELSYDKIVFKLAKKYKKRISKSTIQKFISMNGDYSNE